MVDIHGGDKNKLRTFSEIYIFGQKGGSSNILSKLMEPFYNLIINQKLLSDEKTSWVKLVVSATKTQETPEKEVHLSLILG